MWGGGLALYLVLWLTISEVGASLKWMSWQSELKSGTCIAKQRENPTSRGACLPYKVLGKGHWKSWLGQAMERPGLRNLSFSLILYTMEKQKLLEQEAGYD